MKKFILFAAILFAGVSVVKAQVIADPVQTTLKVNLHPIQSLSIVGSEVNIDYKTREHYDEGTKKDMPGHLIVYSTGGFTVNVKSSNDLIPNNHADNSETIASNGLTVKATQATGNAVLIGNNGDIPLKSGDGSTLFDSDKGGVDLSYDVEYKGPGTDYINKYFANGEITTYETTVTYTLSPK